MIVWVEPAAKVRVSAVITVLIRLEKVLLPPMAWPLPLSSTVPEWR